MVWFRLPNEIWDIVGDFIFSDLSPTANGSINVDLKPARFYKLHFEEGLTFITPTDCSLC
jgi:hypothetical protein